MSAENFDFASFVEHKRTGSWGRDEGVRYAYSVDHRLLSKMSRMRPVELAAASVVRTSGEWLQNQYLGRTVKVGPNQFPSLHKIAEHCAKVLTVPTPTLYVQNSPYPNAMTYGTDNDSFIVVTSALIDHFDEAELKFVIGHETGHIQNKHVVYNTALMILTQGAGIFLVWIIQPALVALKAWSRAAEITCDRAGLLCCEDVHAASRSFMKLATGSHKLYPEMNLDEYLNQLDEGRGGVGRFREVFETHPYLPKRIQALRIFADSDLYRKAIDAPDGGWDMEEVDRRTSKILQINPDKPDAPPAAPGGAAEA